MRFLATAGPPVPLLRKTLQTDTEGPAICPLVTLESEDVVVSLFKEHLKNYRLWCSGLNRRVNLQVDTNVSEENTAPIFRTKVGDSSFSETLVSTHKSKRS
jgi:hypothetical protein